MPVPQWMPNRSKTTALHPVDDDAWRGRSGCIGRWADGVDYTVANPVEANPGFGLPTLLELSRRRCRQMEFFLMPSSAVPGAAVLTNNGAMRSPRCRGQRRQQQRDPDSRNAMEWMHHEQWRLGVTGAHPCRGEVCIMLGMGWTGAAGAREMVLELHKSSWLHSMSWRTGLGQWQALWFTVTIQIWLQSSSI
ncbi:hypothetical protein BD779DRAFT_1475380 [Infundibulicybe gibba]|nr:hypothetical protein BD779DRAFT_1475380 [Infundibulicybe gibba]